jgi:hypothetical protein
LLLFLDAEFERRILDEGEPKPNIKSAFDFDYPDFDATNIAPCRETDLFSFLHSEEEGVSAKEDDEKSPPTVSPNHSGISNVTKDLKAAKNDNNSNREESFDTNIIETSLSTLTDEIEKNGEADLKPFTNNFEEHPHCASYPQMSPEASTTEDQHIKDDNLLDKIEDFPRQSSNDERCIGIEQSDYEYSDQVSFCSDSLIRYNNF